MITLVIFEKGHILDLRSDFIYKHEYIHTLSSKWVLSFELQFLFCFLNDGAK